jgi:hypothetical protein
MLFCPAFRHLGTLTTLIRLVVYRFIDITRYLQSASFVALLPARSLTAWLAYALWFLEPVTGWWLGTVFAVLIQLRL